MRNGAPPQMGQRWGSGVAEGGAWSDVPVLGHTVPSNGATGSRSARQRASVGQIDSNGGSDFTITEVGDTSDSSVTCNLPAVGCPPDSLTEPACEPQRFPSGGCQIGCQSPNASRESSKLARGFEPRTC